MCTAYYFGNDYTFHWLATRVVSMVANFCFFLCACYRRAFYAARTAEGKIDIQLTKREFKGVDF
jgi:hypothetical protein